VDKNRCAWCGTDNDPALTSCTSCGTRLVPLEEGEPIWAVPPESVAPVPPRSTAGWAVPSEPAASPPAEGWGGVPQSGTPPVPATPPGILQSTAAVAYPPQPLPPPNWAPPATWPGSVPKASGSMPGALWAAIAIVVLAAMGFFLYQKMQSAISFPDTLGGYQHDDSQIAKAATDTMESYMKGVGIEAKTAIYGDIGAPAFIVVAFHTGGEPPPGSLDEFMSGFNTTSGSGASLGHQVIETRDGVTYKCGSIVSQQPGTSFSAQAVCLWDDDSTGGFVISTVSSDPKSAVDLTAQVHDGVVG
jgi:hypothetical protein